MSSVSKGTIKQRTIDRIKAGKILTKLQDFALADPDDPDYENKQMTQGRVTAARILLSKVVPDMKQIEHTGDLSVHVNKVERKIVDPETANS